METTKSQEKRIEDYLLRGNSITPIEALERFGCFRLGARIFDLKKKGFEIKTETVTETKVIQPSFFEKLFGGKPIIKTKHFAKYFLIDKKQ
ncbi:MAG: helix-turn-helix domain-containing protein [Lutibacter sp.]|jgi:hypothetical protein